MNIGITNNVSSRVSNLENLSLKVAYYAEITTISGQLSIPQEATILLDQWSNGVDAVLSGIQGGKPIFEETGLDVSLDSSGNYTVIGGNLPTSPIALIYYLSINLKYYSNLDIEHIIEQVSLVAGTTIESTPIQLKAISKLTQPITTDLIGTVPIPEVIQETNGIDIDSNGHITFNIEGFYRIQVQLNINNSNNTNIDTWAEYFNGIDWIDLPDSGNVKDSGNSGIGNFIIETTLVVNNPLTIRLKARTITGTASLVYDMANVDIGVPSCTYIAYKLNPTVKGLAVQTNELSNPFLVGSESSGNYSSWNSNGELRLYGNAIQWDDLVGSLIARRLESTQGTLQYDYDENSITMQSGGDITDNRDRLIFNFQKPHKMNNIAPYNTMNLHIHWEQTNTTVREFTVQYRIQTNGAAKETTWTTAIISSDTASIFPYTSGTIIQITELVKIDLSNAGISATVQFRLARTDSNIGDITATFVDAHIPFDSLGSNEEYIKY